MDLWSKYKKLLQLNRFLLYLLFCITLLSSCRSNGDEPLVPDLSDFLSKDECGLFGYGGYLLRYDEQKSQISINEKRRQVRVQSDDQTAYFNVVFSAIPTSIDDLVSVDFSYKGRGDELSYKMEMMLCKVEVEKVWIWNQEHKLEIIIPRL